MKKQMLEKKIVVKCDCFEENKIKTALKNAYNPHRKHVGQAA